MYFCFCSFFHSYGSFNRDIFNILDLLWVSCTLFIYIFTLFMHRKSSCTFICQVSPLTSSCQFSTFHQCSLLPQASLGFLRVHLCSSSGLHLIGPEASHLAIIRRWGNTHIAKSSSLTSSLFLHLECLSLHSFLALYIPILTLHTCSVVLVDSLS